MDPDSVQGKVGSERDSAFLPGACSGLVPPASLRAGCPLSRPLRPARPPALGTGLVVESSPSRDPAPAASRVLVHVSQLICVPPTPSPQGQPRALRHNSSPATQEMRGRPGCCPLAPSVASFLAIKPKPTSVTESGRSPVDCAGWRVPSRPQQLTRGWAWERSAGTPGPRDLLVPGEPGGG